MTIGVAIIGGGIFAREAHLPAVLATPSLSLKAIYSRSLTSAQSLSPPHPVDLYSDDSGSGKTYHDLLLRSDIQAVIIALPIPNQPEHIEAALAAGKHVLSEKPIAADLKRAKKLIEWYKKGGHVKDGVTWGVAENFRFLEGYEIAREEIAKLGEVKGFSVTSLNYVAGGKYYETYWRKTPSYQGGFLLDGGVHTLAAMRYLLSSSPVTSLSAFTSLQQSHLPPHDTITSILQLSNKASGTLHLSFGSTLSSKSISIASEKGSVTIANDKVTVRGFEDGKEKVIKEVDVKWGDWGVTNEIQAWAKALESGKQDERQRPEEALADLELLELMLNSGDKGGEVQKLGLQI